MPLNAPATTAALNLPSAATSALFCADVHLGNMKSYAMPAMGSLNTRAMISLRVFSSIAEHAKREGCPMVVAGDLFDYPNPEALLTYEVAKAAAKAPQFWPMLGNHDMHSTVQGDNALAALTMSSVTEPKAQSRIAFVPFAPGVVVADYLRECLGKMPEFALNGPMKPRTLVIHAGIADSATPPFMLHKADDFIQASELFTIMEEFGIATVFAGNWHTPRVWSKRVAGKLHTAQLRIVQLGALVPTGFDNPGLMYGMYAKHELNLPAIALHLMTGPRFLTLQHDEPPILRVIDAHFQLDAMARTLVCSPETGPHPPTVRRADSKDHIHSVAKSPYVMSSFVDQLYATVKAPPGADVDAIRADAEQCLRAVLSIPAPGNPNIRPGVLHHLAVVPDARASSVQHETATRAALRNHTHFRAAVEAYLDQMEVPEGVDRGAVLGRVLSYLGRTV